MSVVIGWRWSASLDSLVCGFCLAMHGTEHGVDEEMITHPGNCRCAKSPITQSWSDLGFEDGGEVVIQRGDDWLRGQSQEVQERILGKAGRAAWLDGRFELADMVGVKEDDLLGTIGYRKSLDEILGSVEAAIYKRLVA